MVVWKRQKLLCLLGVIGACGLLYSFLSKEYFPSPLLLTRGKNNLVYFDVLVGEKHKPAMLDLGAYQISVDKELIEKGFANATENKIVSHSLFEETELIMHCLDRIEIGQLVLENFLCQPPHALKYIDLQTGHIEDEGLSGFTIGREAFKDHLMILDLKNGVAFILSSIEEVKKTSFHDRSRLDLKGVFSKDSLYVPGFVDGQALNFILDTGASLNVLFNGVEIGDEVLVQGLPVQNFLKTSFSGPPETDGILGIPFIEQFVFLINFKDQQVHILLPPEQTRFTEKETQK